MNAPETTPARRNTEIQQIRVRGTPIGREEKLELESENRRLLEEDLSQGRLVFRSWPRVVELQLSNFCNMSCTMCYDGKNPPLVKLPEELVAYLGEKLLPTASVLVPFATSEPLIVTWDLTRELAERYGVELEITTNVQFLDEKKFAELEPHAAVVEFSIDSHVPEIYDAIRLRSVPSRVFRNLPVAARLCREHGIKVVANVVFMAENAPHLDGTVAFLADSGIPWVHVQKLYYNREDSHFSDPLAHFSREWIDDMKARCRAVAEKKRIVLDLDFDGGEVTGLEHLGSFRKSRAQDGWVEHLRRFHPGYCPQSVFRLKIDNEGNAYPCCVGAGERLKLGNVYEDPVEEIWNGPNSQDLRRAMLTGDLPRVCQRCNFRTGPILPEMQQRPFADQHFIWLESRPERWVIPMISPAHSERLTAPPTFRWGAPEKAVDEYEVVVSAGGERVDEVYRVPGDTTEFTIPEHHWRQAKPNVAYWWGVWGIRGPYRTESVRSTALRVVIRHQPIPRVPGSTLDYELELPI